MVIIMMIGLQIVKIGAAPWYDMIYHVVYDMMWYNDRICYDII